jgi:hypothetical protein
MAALGDADHGYGGEGFVDTRCDDAGRATYTAPNPRPPAQGGLIILSPQGGTRG